MVVDEAHRMRNKNSALLGCLQQVVHNGMGVHAYQHRVLMTGTPMQNIKEELWPLMNFIDQANFPDLQRFQEKYCKGEPGHEVEEVGLSSCSFLYTRVCVSVLFVCRRFFTVTPGLGL